MIGISFAEVARLLDALKSGIDDCRMKARIRWISLASAIKINIGG